MAINTQSITISVHVERKAHKLLKRRDEWRYARNHQTGVAFVAIPSECVDKRCERGPEPHDHIHEVHPEGKGCRCEAVQEWNAPICSHMRSVQLAREEDAQAEVSASATNLDLVHRETMATVSRPRVPYEALFGANCYVSTCTNDALPDSAGCRLHGTASVF